MHGSMSTWRRLFGALIGAAALAGAVALARPALAQTPVANPASVADPASTASAASSPAPGVWQAHKMSFQFMGFTSTYSCDGLADKLRLLLLAAGARADVKSEPGAYANGFGRPDKFARADLNFYTLSPTGAGAPAGASPAAGPSVPGIWKAVSIAQHSPQQLGLGDCELVEQFRTQVLKLFSTRALENHTSCIPHQESGSLIDLRFEVFTAAPHAARGAAPPSPPPAP